MKPRKIPMRMCVGCREMKGKKELIRVVRTTDGAELDLTGKAQGRGAYVCKNPTCLQRAIKIGALQRALDVKLPEETTLALKTCLESMSNEV